MRFSAFVLLAALLSGCTFAPGMTFRAAGGDGQAAAALAHGTSGRTSATTGASADTTAASDAPPAGAMVEINSNLIADEQAAAVPGIPKDVQDLFAKPGPYALGPGDVLSIIVWDHPELNMPTVSTPTGIDTSGSNAVVSGYTIDSSGFVQFAYVGALKLSGLTEMEARDLLAKQLGRYIRNPQVTLRIQAYRSKRIYLDGEIRVPGLQVMNDLPMSLPEAINRAGGFTPQGDRSVVAVTRGDKTVVVNLASMIEQGINPDNIILRDGDLVRVFSQNDSKVFVLGEVGHTSTLTLNNGRLTLNEALGDAGGISPYSGDASQVYVVRSPKAGKPTVFHLDATSPAAMALANNFELQANDVVFVDASSLVRWSRVVGMFLPSAQTLATGRSIAY
ncbi:MULTISPECIES: polysaccharide biosynthesis/export family protein [Paraburkholderia]|uniref:Polysaccharide export outer membrane protein n=1 Tax=Paraburkholderia phenazinium TaxID=60549 RepID=A0A1N6KRI7_9BURK|nr:polysaccharide biosynthesis/export family protein [Paraburkholderia phenazinium]SIO59159.1 polysaccharide export outer membrane protein [Paraburkholderia phenazinium]